MKIVSRKPTEKRQSEPLEAAPVPGDELPVVELPEVKEIDIDWPFYHEDWVIQGSQR